MDRHFLAYLLLAAMVVAGVMVVVRARYYSRHNVLRRRRLADEARWAERARMSHEDVQPAD